MDKIIIKDILSFSKTRIKNVFLVRIQLFNIIDNKHWSLLLRWSDKEVAMTAMQSVQLPFHADDTQSVNRTSKLCIRTHF